MACAPGLHLGGVHPHADQSTGSSGFDRVDSPRLRGSSFKQLSCSRSGLAHRLIELPGAVRTIDILIAISLY